MTEYSLLTNLTVKGEQTCQHDYVVSSHFKCLSVDMEQELKLDFIRSTLLGTSVKERELDKQAERACKGVIIVMDHEILSGFRKLGLEHIRRLNSSCMLVPFLPNLHTVPIESYSFLHSPL